MEDRARALQVACEQQRERCLYTSTSLFIWLRALRVFRIILVVFPIILGAIAGWDLLKDKPDYRILSAVFAFMAGTIPAVYAALKLDDHLPTAARLAGEYKNLEIRFAELGGIGPTKAADEFEMEYREARSRQEAANAEAYTTPEWCFTMADRKIKKGQYSFSSDQ